VGWRRGKRKMEEEEEGKEMEQEQEEKEEAEEEAMLRGGGGGRTLVFGWLYLLEANKPGSNECVERKEDKTKTPPNVWQRSASEVRTV